MRASTVIAVAAVLMIAGCQESSTSTSNTSSTTGTSGTAAATTPAPAETPAATPVGGFDMTTDKSMEVATSGASTHIQYKDLKVGDGSIAESGKIAMVHYTGWLTDGSKFDSSYDRGQPIQFRLGGGEMIAGWDKGLLGMRVGGKRRLVIPSELGYGPNGRPPVIPANATLVFECELMGLK